MLAGEVEALRARSIPTLLELLLGFTGRADPAVVSADELGVGGTWDGPGEVQVGRDRVGFVESGLSRVRRRSAGLRTVASVEQEGRFVWIRRRRAHDWLVRCPTDDGAERLAAVLREEVELVGRS